MVSMACYNCGQISDEAIPCCLLDDTAAWLDPDCMFLLGATVDDEADEASRKWRIKKKPPAGVDLCATCKAPIDGVGRINRNGARVHPNGCPKKVKKSPHRG